MKKFNIFIISVLTLGFVSCNEDEPGQTAVELESLAMSPQWINYSVAASSELYHDCVKLYASWAGESALSVEEKNIIGNNFYTGHGIPSNGYASLIKTAKNGNSTYSSALSAIEEILGEGGCAGIATEVGEAKIGDANALAKAGDRTNAVLAVESWYSWNSIKDYSDNIISIKNVYAGRRGTIDAVESSTSISAHVKSINAALDTEINNAISNAYNAIIGSSGMQAPFRNYLTGPKVDNAISACTNLSEKISQSLINFVRSNNNANTYNDILNIYADNVVVPTYSDLKDKAKALYEAVSAFQQDPTNQDKLNAACEAWKAARTPWEQSEAILFGPADRLGLDPSLDSWPLDQEEIAGVLRNSNISTVEQFRSAINSDEVRGFHTIELLLFKDGSPRNVRIN